jgi:hypothetical protein
MPQSPDSFSPHPSHAESAADMAFTPDQPEPDLSALNQALPYRQDFVGAEPQVPSAAAVRAKYDLPEPKLFTPQEQLDLFTARLDKAQADGLDNNEVYKQELRYLPADPELRNTMLYELNARFRNRDTSAPDETFAGRYKS